MNSGSTHIYLSRPAAHSHELAFAGSEMHIVGVSMYEEFIDFRNVLAAERPTMSATPDFELISRPFLKMRFISAPAL